MVSFNPTKINVPPKNFGSNHPYCLMISAAFKYVPNQQRRPLPSLLSWSFFYISDVHLSFIFQRTAVSWGPAEEHHQLFCANQLFSSAKYQLVILGIQPPRLPPGISTGEF